jgi:CBS-domain-containing membrane protein
MHRHPFVRLLWCAVGAAAGIAFALHLAAPPVSAFFLASLGGSSIFLFGLTRAAAAQPRALFGGHLGGAAIGIACYQIFGDAPWVYALAQALALAFMLTTRTVHPPAGTNPILMVYVHAGWASLFQPVFLGVLVLALTAAIWSRLWPGLVRYPVTWFEPSPSRPLWGGWDEPEKEAEDAQPMPSSAQVI